MKVTVLSGVALAVLASSLGGCANMDESQRTTATGAAVGAVAGALLGGVLVFAWVRRQTTGGAGKFSPRPHIVDRLDT